MSVLPFLAIAFGFSAASLLLRRWPPASVAVGDGLVASIGAAILIRPDELAIAGGSIAGSDYGRLFLLLGTWTSLGLVLIGLATSLPRNLAGTLLAGLGAAGLALSLPDPTTAVIAAIAGGLAGILITLRDEPSGEGVAVATRELRAIVVAGAFVLLATAWMSRPLGSLAEDPAVFGLAYVAVAIGVAMRFGAIPFHLWAARVADAAPEIALPLLMAWGPAALAVVALAWIDSSIVPVLPISGDLPAERAVSHRHRPRLPHPRCDRGLDPGRPETRRRLRHRPRTPGSSSSPSPPSTRTSGRPVGRGSSSSWRPGPHSPPGPSSSGPASGLATSTISTAGLAGGQVPRGGPGRHRRRVGRLAGLAAYEARPTSSASRSTADPDRLPPHCSRSANFESYQDDPQKRRFNLWTYIDARDGAQAIRLALDAKLKGAHVLSSANSNSLMRRSNDALLDEVFPGTVRKRALQPNESLVWIERAQKVLGYKPEFDWRG